MKALMHRLRRATLTCLDGKRRAECLTAQDATTSRTVEEFTRHAAVRRSYDGELGWKGKANVNESIEFGKTELRNLTLKAEKSPLANVTLATFLMWGRLRREHD